MAAPDPKKRRILSSHEIGIILSRDDAGGVVVTLRTFPPSPLPVEGMVSLAHVSLVPPPPAEPSAAVVEPPPQPVPAAVVEPRAPAPHAAIPQLIPCVPPIPSAQSGFTPRRAGGGLFGDRPPFIYSEDEVKKMIKENLAQLIRLARVPLAVTARSYAQSVMNQIRDYFVYRRPAQ